MINFQYARATDVADAVRQIAADPRAKFIAGGTNLIDLMKDDVESPTRLIDISRLPLTKVEEIAGGGLRIGAMVPNSNLAWHPLIEQRYPLLSSRRRIVHAGGDASGRDIIRALVRKVYGTPSITVCEATRARRLIVEDNEVTGVLCQTDRDPVVFSTDRVVIATGRHRRIVPARDKSGRILLPGPRARGAGRRGDGRS